MTRIETALLGEPMVRLTVHLPESLRNHIEDMAYDECRSVSEMAWLIFEAGIRNRTMLGGGP